LKGRHHPQTPFTPVFSRAGELLRHHRRIHSQVQSAKILPKSATEDLFRLYGELARVYPRHDPDLVASHNDLKTENILFDGDPVRLVDWEAAFLNDRYADLARHEPVPLMRGGTPRRLGVTGRFR
jgi:thiamine kinase-like enzyme